MSLQKGELQIRDLLLRLKVITHGLVEERKKSKIFLERAKDFEQSLKQKENENTVLSKANIDLQSKLLLERSKKAPNKKGGNNAMDELLEKSNKLEDEIKALNQRLMEKEESADREFVIYQTKMVLKDEEITKLKNDLEKEKEKYKKLEEDQATIDNEEKINEIYLQHNTEKDELLKNIDNLKQELEEEKKNRDEIDKLKKE